MPNTSAGQANETEPLFISVHTLAGERTWSYVTLHEDSPSGLNSGWAHLDSLPSKVRDDLKRLCVDPESTFSAVVNSEPCVVIEQEFQASDSSDDWPETAAEVVARLKRSLLPRVAALLRESAGAAVGVAVDPGFTFCGRPTVLVVLPVDDCNERLVRAVLECVHSFAYPVAEAA
jgi:hypothetical protein